MRIFRALPSPPGIVGNPRLEQFAVSTWPLHLFIERRAKHLISDSVDMGVRDLNNDQEQKIRDKLGDKGYHKQSIRQGDKQGEMKFALEFVGT